MTTDTVSNAVPEKREQPLFVTHSTPESIDAGTVSLLACAETILAVLGYAFVAWQFGYFPYWWTSILLLPLVLLRSDASVALGVEWMKTYWENRERYPEKFVDIIRRVDFWIVILLSFLAASYAYYYLTKLWLVNVAGIEIFWKAALIVFAGLAVAVATAEMLTAAVVGPILKESPIEITIAVARFGVLAVAVAGAQARDVAIMAAAGVLVAGTPIGIGFRALLIRVFSSALHPVQGLKALPQNWKRNLFVIDLCHLPELVPNNPIEYLNPKRYFYYKKKESDSLIKFIVLFDVGLFLFGQVWIYRLIMKSSCWFYLPLFYLLYLRPHERANDPKEMRDRILGHPFNWVQFILAPITIFGSVLTAASTDWGRTLKDAMTLDAISPLEVLMVLDWSTLHYWQWLTLGSAVVTVYVFWDVFNLNIDLKQQGNAAIAKVACSRAWRLEYTLRFRFVLVVFWMLLVFGHFAVNSPLGTHIPPATLETLKNIFK